MKRLEVRSRRWRRECDDGDESSTGKPYRFGGDNFCLVISFFQFRILGVGLKEVLD